MTLTTNSVPTQTFSGLHLWALNIDQNHAHDKSRQWFFKIMSSVRMKLQQALKLLIITNMLIELTHFQQTYLQEDMEQPGLNAAWTRYESLAFKELIT